MSFVLHSSCFPFHDSHVFADLAVSLQDDIKVDTSGEQSTQHAQQDYDIYKAYGSSTDPPISGVSVTDESFGSGGRSGGSSEPPSRATHQTSDRGGFISSMSPSHWVDTFLPQLT